MKTLAVITAGCRGTRLGLLSQNRAEAAVPFAGKYRVIDFALSNCANSGILNVGILTQYHPLELCDHIGTGKPWDLDRRWSGGVTLLMPYQRNGGFFDWYRGTADAVTQNLDFVAEQEVDTVLVLPGEQVYKMDYTPLLQYHQDMQADVTICVTGVNPDKPSQFGFVSTGEDGQVRTFENRPSESPNLFASTGILAFRTDALVNRLTQNGRFLGSMRDFSTDLLPRMLELGDQLYTYPFEGYWADLDTVETFWEANMRLLLADPPLDLQDPDWRIHTRSEERPPVSISAGAVVSNSLITDGCIVQGRVENSVLSPGVRVKAGALVRDSIVFSDCEIGPAAVVERAILDKNVFVGGHALVRCSDGAVSHRSITLVAQNTHVPAGSHFDPNFAINTDLIADDRLADAITHPRWVSLEASESIAESALAAHR